MSREIRVRQPSLRTAEMLRWMQDVTDALNAVPSMVMFSGNPNTSGVTGGVGTLGVNTQSGATQRLWVNQSGATNTWSWLSYI